MKRKLTPLIDELIKDIYPRISHDEKITENIFVFIENNRKYSKIYHELCDEFTRDPINNMIGKRVKILYNLVNGRTAIATNTTLIKSYQQH